VSFVLLVLYFDAGQVRPLVLNIEYLLHPVVTQVVRFLLRLPLHNHVRLIIRILAIEVAPWLLLLLNCLLALRYIEAPRVTMRWHCTSRPLSLGRLIFLLLLLNGRVISLNRLQVLGGFELGADVPLHDLLLLKSLVKLLYLCVRVVARYFVSL